jgi:molybdopterin-containing oxidoreductase family membrane subunit
VKNSKVSFVGIFSSIEAVVAAISGLKRSGIRPDKVYSPARNEEITDLLEMKPSPVRYFTLAGGITGVLFGYALATHAATRWNFIVWGKPAVVVVPYVIVMFEFCILFSVFATLIGIALYTRLPSIRLPAEYDPRFSRDHYGVVVFCEEKESDRIREILSQSGAAEVREIPRGDRS